MSIYIYIYIYMCGHRSQVPLKWLADPIEGSSEYHTPSPASAAELYHVIS